MKFDLNNINMDFENYGLWPMPIKLMLTAILCALLLFLGYSFDTSEQLQSLNSLVKQEESLREKFAYKQRIVNDRPIYQAQIQQLDRRVQKILQILPSQIEVAGLLDEISKIGMTNGLKFQLIKPRDIQQHEFYTELPIDISVDGNYHQFAQFISDVAALNQIVTLDDFVIRRADDQNAKSQTGSQIDSSNQAQIPLQMQITARIYWAASKTAKSLDDQNPMVQAGRENVTKGASQ